MVDDDFKTNIHVDRLQNSEVKILETLFLNNKQYHNIMSIIIVHNLLQETIRNIIV